MATKPKAKKKTNSKKSASAAPRSGPPRQSRARVRPPPPPRLTLKQELMMMARDGARSLERLFLTLIVLMVVAGLTFGAWSLRPIPSYSSEEVKDGSPFDVTFKVENKDPWFPLANLKVGCVLDHVRASGLPPTLLEATDVRFSSRTTTGLEPGESATFTCPYRMLIGHPINDDPGIVQRSEIYFQAKYDLPLIGSIRLTDNSARFFLNTRLLPPRWTSKP
ncbi:hypothetical protein [Reyranella sp.]|uniref:hypothetical protein n=1 Tax=Reyranella sp. TaxID=1929291 RepID=UPI00121DF02D|nr:hypothetical protein [Reyranella sp.]TAJ83800.1 MAG: hypothetical protein EPO50_22230 [Reyranella sp.]